jgi:hypothetical protein
MTEKRPGDAPKMTHPNHALSKLSVLALALGEIAKEEVDQAVELEKYQSKGLPYPAHRIEFRKKRLKSRLLDLSAIAETWWCEISIPEEPKEKVDLSSHHD